MIGKPWWMPEDVEPQQVIDMYESGMSIKEIVQTINFKCTRSPVYKWIGNYVKVRHGNVYVKDKKCLGCSKPFNPNGFADKLCRVCAPNGNWTKRFYQHGITKSKFDEMMNNQSGLCDLCEEVLPNNLTEIYIDHCHKQGHVRALIHRKCNVGLHYIEDDKFLAQAIRYIERHKK